jgi:beta-fructofuranosidase
MHNWQRVGSGLALDISGPDYEDYTPGHWHDRAMRDPYVIRNPDGEGWLMYFTARVDGIAEPNAGGAIGLAVSPDLAAWTLSPPIYRGGMFGQMEVPEVLRHAGRWYCLFCTAGNHWSAAYRRLNRQAPVTGTHYLVADDARGPWQVAPGPFLDGDEPCHRYAGKLVETDEGLVFLGFLHTAADGRFIGAIADPVQVMVGPDGLLALST